MSYEVLEATGKAFEELLVMSESVSREIAGEYVLDHMNASQSGLLVVTGHRT